VSAAVSFGEVTDKSTRQGCVTGAGYLPPCATIICNSALARPAAEINNIFNGFFLLAELHA